MISVQMNRPRFNFIMIVAVADDCGEIRHLNYLGCSPIKNIPSGNPGPVRSSYSNVI